MAFDLLGVGQSPSLYPLYSDIDSDIETSNDQNINLMVPSSIRRQRYSKSSNNKLTKTYNYYRSMQNRNRGRGRNRIYKNNNNNNHMHMNMNMNRNRNRNKRRRGRHVPKSASLNALSFITSPRPYGVTDGGDREFVYNLTQKINNISQERPSLNGRRLNQPQNNNANNPNKPNSNSNSKQFGNQNNHNSNQNQNKKKTQKRRIRTFYSKKWGNRLYNLRENNIPQTIRSHSCEIPDMLRADRRQDIDTMNTSSRLRLWQNEVNDARKSLTAFIEEENLDLNDIKSPRSVSPSASPNPMPMHLGVDFRMDQDSQTVYYDSAASNIASNTDMDSNDEDDDEEEDIECTPTPSPNPNGPIQIHRDFTPTPAPNLGYNLNDRSSANSRITRYINDDHEDESEVEMGSGSNHGSSANFKIIVSAPNDEEHTHTNLYNHSQTLNDRQNELMSRLKPKRSRRRYIPSVIESGASDDCSSCDDDDDVTTTGDEMEYNGKSSLFLSENNLQRGVYASFGFSDTETDYLSAQSDDFDELTICYHHRDRNHYHHNNNNLSVNNAEGKNIRFRNHLNDTNYLSDMGPSDIGSSDTECFSSNDSIPDSIPPPLHHDHDIDDDFVSIN